MTYFLIFISAVFVNNIVLTQFLGVQSIFDVSKRINSALSFTAVVALIMTVSSVLIYFIQTLVLQPYGLEYLRTLAFIVLIVGLVQLTGFTFKSISKSWYMNYEIYRPHLTANCVILGVALLSINKNYDLSEYIVFAVSSAFGFGLVSLIFAGIQEQLKLLNLPKRMEGLPIILIAAGLLAMAFMGFVGIAK